MNYMTSNKSIKTSFLFLSRDYNYVWGMTYVALQADDRPGDRTDESMLDHSSLLPTLRECYIQAPMDGQHRNSCVWQIFANHDQIWAQ